MKRIVLLLLLFVSHHVFAERFYFNFVDKQQSTYTIGQNLISVDKKPIVAVEWYNYSQFLLEWLDLNYTSHTASISHNYKTINGRVEVYDNVIYFYPQKSIQVGQQLLIKIEFRFYGQAFRYDLDLEDKLFEIEMGKFWLGFNMIDKDQLWEHDWVYQRNSYIFDGNYYVAPNLLR